MKRNQSLRFVVAVAAVVLTLASPARAGFIGDTIELEEPDGQGDSVIFYYDAREGFKTYINVRNADENSVDVLVYFYPFTGSNVVEGFTLASNELRIIDTGAEQVPPGPGVAIAITINSESEPVVTRALTGNFTVANLATGSAWGAAGAARSAIMLVSPAAGVSGTAFTYPAKGTLIDGTNVFYQPIQADELDLATYYNPNDLAPVTQSGNQLIFVSFEDRPGDNYEAAAATTTWDLIAARNDGSLIAAKSYEAEGVVVTDLESLVGAGVNGASGSIRFLADTTEDHVTRLIYFAESLGTFGTGYLLPAPSLPPE